MKSIEYYLKLPYRLEIVPDIYEGGYVASYPELPGCLTCAETIEEVIASAFDAKRAWLEAALEDGDTIQEPSSLDNYSGQFKLRMPKSLHKQLAEQSKKEGISMNQYCLYLLSQNNALHYNTEALAAVAESEKNLANTAKMKSYSSAEKLFENYDGDYKCEELAVGGTVGKEL